jgi:hypothetical protein
VNAKLGKLLLACILCIVVITLVVMLAQRLFRR